MDAQDSLIHPKLKTILSQEAEIAQMPLPETLARRAIEIVALDGFLSQHEQRQILKGFLEGESREELPTPDELEQFFAASPPGVIRVEDDRLIVHCPSTAQTVAPLSAFAKREEVMEWARETETKTWNSKAQQWEFPVSIRDELSLQFPEFTIATPTPQLEIEEESGQSLKWLEDLQNAYAGYKISVQPAKEEDRFTLTVVDPDGQRLIRQMISDDSALPNGLTETLDQHEQQRTRPEMTGLRAEFPELRFTTQVTSVGQVVRAYEQAGRECLATGILANHKGETAEGPFLEYKGRLRSAGYGISSIAQDVEIGLTDNPPKTLEELRSRFPGYELSFHTAGMDRDRYETLWVSDPDGSLVATLGRQEYGEPIIYARAQQKIQIHEENRNRPMLVELRQEFPTLRFESRLTDVGEVVDAIDKTTRNRIALGMAANSEGEPTPEKLEGFKQSLRQSGYDRATLPKPKNLGLTGSLSDKDQTIIKIVEAIQSQLQRKIQVIAGRLDAPDERYTLSRPDQIRLIRSPDTADAHLQIKPEGTYTWQTVLAQEETLNRWAMITGQRPLNSQLQLVTPPAAAIAKEPVQIKQGRSLLEPSTGHLGYLGESEYYKPPQGDVARANIDDEIQENGYRSGRFECTEAAWQNHPVKLQIQEQLSIENQFATFLKESGLRSLIERDPQFEESYPLDDGSTVSFSRVGHSLYVDRHDQIPHYITHDALKFNLADEGWKWARGESLIVENPKEGIQSKASNAKSNGLHISREIIADLQSCAPALKKELRLEGELLESALLDRLQSKQWVGLEALQKEFGHSQRDSQDPLSNPVNAALKNLRDTHRVAATDGWGDPKFTIVESEPPIVSNADVSNLMDQLLDSEMGTALKNSTLIRVGIPNPERESDILSIERIGKNLTLTAPGIDDGIHFGLDEQNHLSYKGGDPVGDFRLLEQMEADYLSHDTIEIRPLAPSLGYLDEYQTIFQFPGTCVVLSEDERKAMDWALMHSWSESEELKVAFGEALKSAVPPEQQESLVGAFIEVHEARRMQLRMERDGIIDLAIHRPIREDIEIVASGQTGAAIAALQTAFSLNIPTSGAAPGGWRTETGNAPHLAELGLKEQATPDYRSCAQENTRATDGTVFFGDPALSAYTQDALQAAQETGKPFLVLEHNEIDAGNLRKWVEASQIYSLHVAGLPESKGQGISEVTSEVIREAFSTPILRQAQELPQPETAQTTIAPHNTAEPEKGLAATAPNAPPATETILKTEPRTESAKSEEKTILAAESKSAKLTPVPKVAESPVLPEVDPSLLLDWRLQAEELGKPEAYLKWIDRFVEVAGQSPSGFELPNKASERMVGDQRSYQQMIAPHLEVFRSQAQQVLETGQPENNGERSFIGSMYWISGEPESFQVMRRCENSAVNAPEYRKIFQIKEGEIVESSVSKTDLQRFNQAVQSEMYWQGKAEQIEVDR